MVFAPFTQSPQHRLFAKQLLEEAFPPEERPTFDDIEKRRNNIYHLCVIEQDSKMLGIFAYWNFSTFSYIEHFAIVKTLRNNGIGSAVLSRFLQTGGLGRQIVLEVEPPETPLAQRRIDFYQMHGLLLNPQPYLQPPYIKGGQAVPMQLITRFAIDNEEFEKVKNTLYTKVYGQQAAF